MHTDLTEGDRNKVLCCHVQAPAPVKPNQCTANICDLDPAFCGFKDVSDSISSVERRSSSTTVEVESYRTSKIVKMLGGTYSFRMRNYPSRIQLWADRLRRQEIPPL